MIGILMLVWLDGMLLDLVVIFCLMVIVIVVGIVVIILYLCIMFGKIVIVVCENEICVEFLGYNVVQFKLIIFMLGGVLVGFGGCLFVNWGVFVSLMIFSLVQLVQIIIWVIVGGCGMLIGLIFGCIVL